MGSAVRAVTVLALSVFAKKSGALISSQSKLARANVSALRCELNEQGHCALLQKGVNDESFCDDAAQKFLEPQCVQTEFRLLKSGIIETDRLIIETDRLKILCERAEAERLRKWAEQWSSGDLTHNAP